MNTSTRKPPSTFVRVTAGIIFGGGLALVIVVALLPDDLTPPVHAAPVAASVAQVAAPVAVAAPVVAPVAAMTLAQKWGQTDCKAGDDSCDKLAAEAEAEYQAQGGDAHEDAENRAVRTPEFQAATDYFLKFQTAEKSGGTRTELCALLGLAHLEYVQAGASDEADYTREKQTKYSCPRS